MTATVNTTHSIQESNYSNNSFTKNVNTMVLCKVEDSGSAVPFASQADLRWGSQPFGLSTNILSTMTKFGCSITDLYMLFSSYGIKKVPLGSPANPGAVGVPELNGADLTPGTLNSAMANYSTNFITNSSVALNHNNDLFWAGAVDVARAGYRAQCTTAGCNPNDAFSKVSYKHQLPYFADEKAAITGIQNEICSGNPVILKFGKRGGGQHFMLATGIVFDKENKLQTLRLNNPGIMAGDKQFYNKLKVNYPTFLGGPLYRPTFDPTMMFISAPLNVHLVITDPLGRRSGFDPTSGTTYSEIPGATYEVQSIDTPNEVGYTPETLVAERYFVNSSDVPVGDYQVQVFSVTGGSYYVDYRGFDATGTTNKSIVQSGTLQAGQSATVSILHTDLTMPVPNAKIHLEKYAIHNIHQKGSSKSNVHISGKITPNVKTSLSLGSGFVLMLGGIGEYKLTVPAASFKVKREHKEISFEYHNKDVEVEIDSDGEFEIKLRHADLNNVNQNELGLVTITLDDIIGQVNSKIYCHKNMCSLKHEEDREYLRHNDNKEKER